MALFASNDARCKHCGKPRQQQQQQNSVARLVDSGRRSAAAVVQAVAQAIAKLSSGDAGVKHNQLQAFLSGHFQLGSKPMLASTSAWALGTVKALQPQEVAAGGSKRPSWVREPPPASLALADQIAKNASVGWSGFIRPVDAAWEVSSKFGPRWGRHHNGVDLAAPAGEPVLAADSGQVTYAGWEPGGYGYLVEITHRDGWKTLYAHNSDIFTWEGQQVKRGQCIASVGETGKATGPHLHWEIRNKFGHPVDPLEHVDL